MHRDLYETFTQARLANISARSQPTRSLLPQLSPSTMLVLAKKPDEAFKAPLNTKKQAPVTGKGEKKKRYSASLIEQ